MNCYEHTLIIKQDLSENAGKQVIDKYEGIINKNSGKVIKTENWGLKILSHKINNNKKGFYFHIKFEGIGKTIEELEKAENIDEMLVRFLTVKVKKHDLETNYFVKKEDNVELIVLEISDKDRKIFLGMKQMTENPWSEIKKQYLSGQAI